MGMEGLISLVELGCHHETNYVVVSHHSYRFIRLFVLLQHLSQLLGSLSQVSRTLVDERLLHAFKNSLHDLLVLLLLILTDYLVVFGLVLLTLVGQEPKLF